VEHLYIKFDGPSSIGFGDIVRKNTETNSDENPTTSASAVGVVTTKHLTSRNPDFYVRVR